MCVLAGMASVLEVEDEPEEMYSFNSLQEHARLEELARRNSLYLPHLRSVYPLEQLPTEDSHVITAARSTTKDKSRSAASVVQVETKDISRSRSVGGRVSVEQVKTRAMPSSAVNDELISQDSTSRHRVNCIIVISIICLLYTSDAADE